MRVSFESATRNLLGLPGLNTFLLDTTSVARADIQEFVERVDGCPRDLLHGIVASFDQDHVTEFSFWSMLMAAGRNGHEDFAQSILQEGPIAARLAMRHTVLNSVCRNLSEETAALTIEAIFKKVEYINGACKTEAARDNFLTSVIENLSQISPERRQQVLDSKTAVADPVGKMIIVYGLGATIGERLRRMGAVEIYPDVSWVQDLKQSHPLTFTRNVTQAAGLQESKVA